MIRPLDEAERAANWKAARRALRRYACVVLCAALWLIWSAAYWTGYFDGERHATAAHNTKESNHES